SSVTNSFLCLKSRRKTNELQDLPKLCDVFDFARSLWNVLEYSKNIFKYFRRFTNFRKFQQYSTHFQEFSRILEYSRNFGEFSNFLVILIMISNILKRAKMF